MDTICRDILSAEKDVVAYIEQFGWNSDVHLNNFSLIETDESSGAYFFDAYDMLPINTVNPADTEQTVMTLNGKKRNFHRNDFLKIADTRSMEITCAWEIIDRLKEYKSELIWKMEESYLADELKERLILLIEERINSI